MKFEGSCPTCHGYSIEMDMPVGYDEIEITCICDDCGYIFLLVGRFDDFEIKEI